ncbi:NLR family CARD domain-containing protein 3-like isoform X3 [Colossoma macropomum]|uniref:NLR family CARD domain-containing protein 3-like isoform X3 n=1 Tax=Colossoma macropomum TaxID=42526 RepID=UPI0018648532|nr:NLR family CARD domain-containing protein 3-like isoform X3 [Colossoma macropomum]
MAYSDCSDRELDVRVVLLGRVGAGKSESGNTLLGSSSFFSELSASEVTQQCEAQTVTLGGRRIMVVDTPGLTATMDSNTAKEKLLQCLQLSAPGPHVFLLVIRLGRFTQEERNTVERVIEVFGKKLYMFTIILFTFKGKNTSIEEYIRTAGDSLQQLVQKCGSRYHAFSENPGEKGQVELIAKIDKLVAANGGRWYTNTDDEMEHLEIRLKHQHLGGGSLTSKSVSGEHDTEEIERAQKERTKITMTRLESIFQELEHKIISLVKNQLKRLKELLSPDFPACSEREVGDEVDQTVREGTLQIALHVLRNMNQTDLANTLQTKLAPACHQKLKFTLKEKFQKINEGISYHGGSTLLNEIYTELYITEGGSIEVNNEHEVRQIETASRRPATQERPINCNDIFKDKAVRTVLTKGVAGIGKTVSVQKFILDWAEGKANQDIHFIFPLPFRELNFMKSRKHSLVDLLHQFFTDIKELKPTDYYQYKVLFIFDGLDESRLSLDFQNNESLSDVTQSASVDVLLTNLIKGNLLPYALIWITSRPAACDQIPSDLVTQIQGFNDIQKEEYCRKRISDQILANRIIKHMKSLRSLYIMCHIPAFCRIAANSLEKILCQATSGDPKTLTQVFIHFLMFQIKHDKQKYRRKSDADPRQTRKIILALGKLAFQQLEKGSLIFYEENLRECGIDVREELVFLGLCTQIFREEFGLHLGKVFSFVHQSVQEFLAALYAFFSYSISEKRNVLEQQTHLKSIKTDFLKSAVDRALQSENGLLDLFLRFLLGFSLESNQTLLRGLLTQTGSTSNCREETVEYIKEKLRENLTPEKYINLFHCLNELNDHSLVQEVQTYLNRGNYPCLDGVHLSPAQWSALVFVLLNTEEELDEFYLRKYDQSEECLLRLLPVVTASRKADLSRCDLSERSCAALVSALSSNTSSLRELDLSQNKLCDSGVTLLSAGLENQHCKLEKLRLHHCSITEKGCIALFKALKSNPSHLRELDLGRNKPGESGVKMLSALLEDPHCKLEKLDLCGCHLSEKSCAALASAISSNTSSLRDLDLSDNNLRDSGVTLLSAGLENQHCKLEKLRLHHCSITEKGCIALFKALKSNPSYLRELDLGWNKPGESEVKMLSALLEDPHCKLEKLDIQTPFTVSMRLSPWGLMRHRFGPL